MGVIEHEGETSKSLAQVKSPSEISVGDWVRRHRPQLMLAVRIVVAALATFVLGHLLGLRQSYWAVLTAIIVTQASVGGAFKAIADRLAGSLGGAVWGVIVCLVFPHRDVWTLTLALVVAIAPLAVATAYNPGWRIAPVTALIMLLAPSAQAGSPTEMAVSRMLEIGVGSLVAAVVTLLLARSQATQNLAQAGGSALRELAVLVVTTVEAIVSGRPTEGLEPIHARVRAALAKAETAAAEIARERVVAPQGALDPAPLCRTVRRLHHDLIMVARAASAPLPEAARARLQEPLDKLAAELGAFLTDAAEALAHRRAPPAGEAVVAALAGEAEAVSDLRALGMTRAFADDEVARLYGLAFALEQLGANLADLSARAEELALR